MLKRKKRSVLIEKKKDKKKKKWKRVVFWIFMSILILILAIAVAVLVTFSVLYNKGKVSMSNEEIKVTAPEGATLIDDGWQVQYNGKKYTFNENITTILVMGVDKQYIESEGDEGRNGQADAIILLVADTETGDVDVINVSRDSMTNVSVYSSSGNHVRDDRAQLCLAYAYANTQEESCLNVMKSLSELMYGIPINSYFALDLEGVRVAANAVDGVTVPEYTSDLTKPTGRNITVWGKDAEIYVRDRNLSQLDSNLTRMDRQKAFITSFANKVVSMTKSDLTAPVKLYNKLDEYMCSDITADKVTYLAATFMDGISSMEFHSVKGEVVKGAKYAEFEVDPTALYELIIEVFYTEVN